MNNLKKFSTLFIGTLFLGFGVSFSLKAAFGNGPMGVFVHGLSLHLPLTYGTCNALVGVIEIIIGYLTQKENVTKWTWILLLCGSYSMDLGNFLIPNVSLIYLRVFYLGMALVFYNLGIAMQQYAHMGLGNLDCFIFGLGNFFKIKDYRMIRMIIEVTMMIVGIILGGKFGIGTITQAFLNGSIVVFFLKNIKKALS